MLTLCVLRVFSVSSASLKPCTVIDLIFSMSLLFEVFSDAEDTKKTQRTQRDNNYLAGVITIFLYSIGP